MDTSAFNILEQVVANKVSDKGARQGPRILVTKVSLIPAQFKRWFAGADFQAADRRGYDISGLMALKEQRNWALHFQPDPFANNVDRPVIELHHEHYSDLVRDTHSQMLFSFSAPVPTRHGFLFYGTADRGFLWAHGFLCRFQGSFDAPTAIEYMNVWQS